MKLIAMNYRLLRQRRKTLKADDRALKPCNATHRTFKVTGSELNQKREVALWQIRKQSLWTTTCIKH